LTGRKLFEDPTNQPSHQYCGHQKIADRRPSHKLFSWEQYKGAKPHLHVNNKRAIYVLNEKNEIPTSFEVSDKLEYSNTVIGKRIWLKKYNNTTSVFFELAQQGKDAWNAWREENPDIPDDFDGVDFTLEENKVESFSGFHFGDSTYVFYLSFYLRHYLRYLFTVHSGEFFRNHVNDTIE